MKIRREPIFDPRKEREVSQDLKPVVGPSAPPITNQDAPPQRVAELLDNMNGVADKANRLYDAAADVASRLTIPVPEEVADVRAAVARIDPNSDGSFITFNLYIKAKDRVNTRLADSELLEFASKITGISALDGKMVLPSHGNKDKNPKLNWALHFALLLAANKLLSGPMANETSKQTSVKTGSSEVPGVISSWLVSLVMMQALHQAEAALGEGTSTPSAMEELTKDFKNAVKDEGLTPEKLLQSYNDEALKSQPDIDLVKNHMEDSDWDMMEQFADDYIVNTKEPGYEDWAIAEDAREADRDIRAAANEVAKYADVATLGQAISLPNDVYKLHRCRTDGTNTRLDLAAAALNSKYAADMVCCLVMFLGKMDIKGLKSLRTFLGFLLKGISIDLGSIMKRMGQSFRASLKKALMEPLYHKIRKFFKNIGSDIQKWLSSDDKKWKAVFACTPLDEIFTYILKALKKMEKLLIHMLDKLWAGVQLKHVDWALKTGHLADKAKLTNCLKILNGVIKAIDKGNLCADDGTGYPSEETARRVTLQLLGELPQPPKLDLERTGDPYRDFNPIAFDTPQGVRIQPAIDSASQNYDIKAVSPRDCIKRLTGENIIPLVITEETQNVQRFNDLFTR